MLTRLSRGVFAKGKQYDIRELAASLYSPSYISFETVLREAGIIFQHYDTTFVAARWPKTVTIDGHAFVFRKIKDAVLFNTVGIIHKDTFSIATPERAFLDMVYLFPDYYFDNLRSIDLDLCEKIAGIYSNKKLVKRLQAYKKEYAQ